MKTALGLLVLFAVFLLLAAALAFGQAPGPHTVTLTWTNPNAAGAVVSFNVKRATVSGGPYTTISTAGAVTTTTYVDTASSGNPLVEGMSYFYVVTAVGQGGPTDESGPSNEAKATIPFFPPSPPTGLSAAPK